MHSVSSDSLDAGAAWPLGIWLAILAMAFATFSIVSAEFLPAGLLTPMAADLGISEGLAGQAVTATAAVGAVAALFANVAIGRLDRKHVLIALSLLVVVSNLLAAFATNFYVLLAARATLGIALSGFWSLATAVVARLVGVSAIGRGMSILFIGVSGATIAAPSIGALVSDLFGWRAALLTATGAAGVATLLQIFALPRLPAEGNNNLFAILALTRRRSVQLGLMAVVMVIAGHFAGFVYIRAFLEQVPRLPSNAVAGALLAFGVASFIGNIVGGRLADRNLRLALATTGLVLSGATLTLAAFGANPVIAAVFVALWGFAFGTAPIVLQTRLAKAAPDDLEGIGSLMVVAFQVAIALGAVIGGSLVDNLGIVTTITFTGVMALSAVSLATARVPQPALAN